MSSVSNFHGDHAEQGERMATVRRAEPKLLVKKLVSFWIPLRTRNRTELFADDVKEYSYKLVK